MAVSNTLKGVSVSIAINGIEAKEYKAPDEEEHDCPKHTKIIYIESISGTNHAIHVGEIKITVFRKQVLEQTNLQTGDHDNGTKLEIAEKAVKGQSLSHGTEFGEAVRSRARALIFETKPARGASDPAAVFIFRYRSREALQAEHIIPRDQSPDILHGLSEEDIRRIARERLSENEDNKMNIKKELNACGEIWAKRSTEDKSYIIDLTGDEVVDVEEAKAPKPPRETVDLCDDDDMEPGTHGTTNGIHGGGLFVDDERGGGNDFGYSFGF